MSKLLSILMASALLAFGGLAAAADDQQSKDTAAEQTSAEGKTDSSEATAPQNDSAAQPGGEASADDAEYLADIKKCEEMSGAEKTNCMDEAKKKAGRM